VPKLEDPGQLISVTANAAEKVRELQAREADPSQTVSGTQIHPSCCSAVFVDQSTEPVASLDLSWWVGGDEA
jgi:hypothetical protein